MKYDVFISYSRKDTAIADQICAAFDKAGISYFIDRQEIGGGMEFPKVLALAIRESEIFLLIASQNAYDSAFTDREITFAFNKKRGEKMLPYIIDDALFPEHLELIFSTNNWRNLKMHPIETVLIQDMLHLLGRTSGDKPPYKQQETSTNSNSENINNNELKPKKQNGSFGFVDTQDKTIIPFIFDDACEFSEGLALVEKNSKWGFINKLGNTIIPFIFDDAYGYSEGLAPVESDNKWGFIDKQGNIIIPFLYDEAFEFEEGLARVKKDETWGFIDKQGNTIIPFEYENAWPYSEGLAGVKKNGKYGYIDKQGTTLIPFEFVFALSFEHGKAEVTKCTNDGRETFFINKQGNRID